MLFILEEQDYFSFSSQARRRQVDMTASAAEAASCWGVRLFPAAVHSRHLDETAMYGIPFGASAGGAGLGDRSLLLALPALSRVEQWGRALAGVLDASSAMLNDPSIPLTADKETKLLRLESYASSPTSIAAAHGAHGSPRASATRFGLPHSGGRDLLGQSFGHAQSAGDEYDDDGEMSLVADSMEAGAMASEVPSPATGVMGDALSHADHSGDDGDAHRRNMVALAVAAVSALGRRSGLSSAQPGLSAAGAQLASTPAAEEPAISAASALPAHPAALHHRSFAAMANGILSTSEGDQGPLGEGQGGDEYESVRHRLSLLPDDDARHVLRSLTGRDVSIDPSGIWMNFLAQLPDSDFPFLLSLLPTGHAVQFRGRGRDQPRMARLFLREPACPSGATSRLGSAIPSPLSTPELGSPGQTTQEPAMSLGQGARLRERRGHHAPPWEQRLLFDHSDSGWVRQGSAPSTQSGSDWSSSAFWEP
jgi:hypothetical protein